MSCIFCGASAGISSSEYVAPSIRARTKPAFWIASITSRCAPRRPRTSGARIITRVSGGRPRIVCSISASVCWAIGVPHVGAQHGADAGHEQPQVVVDLGDRADRAPRVRRRRLLVDRDRRLQAVDAVDVRPLHLLEELPRVDRQALHILPLPLGQQRIERQRAFPRPADARDHDELVARDIDIDILQVVRPSAAN